MGGETWALRGMDVYRAGARANTSTLLVAGLELEQMKRLDALKRSIEQCNTHMARVLERFGLARIDLAQIRHMLAATSGPRRKFLAQSARKLGQLVQVYQKLDAERERLQEKHTSPLQRAEIRVRKTAFPGVQIRMGEHRRTLTREVRAPRFRVRDGQLVEH